HIMDVIKANPMLGHITTFGGHPVSCAAALASLDVILEEKLIEDVERKAKLFRQELAHPKIKEIRGLGLMMCLQVENFHQVYSVSKYCADHVNMIDCLVCCMRAMSAAHIVTLSGYVIFEDCQLICPAVETFC